MDRHRNRKKYQFITVDGKTKGKHRHVMEQFLGRPLRTNEHVHHIDGDGTNNELSNLKIMDEVDHNRLSGRTTLTGAKLTIEDVRDVRKMLADKIKQCVIAIAFGVSREAISAIKIGKKWAWVT